MSYPEVLYQASISQEEPNFSGLLVTFVTDCSAVDLRLLKRSIYQGQNAFDVITNLHFDVYL